MGLEIQESCASDNPKAEEIHFRKTKPGSKRFVLTLSVVLLFILASPFLLKSVEIYRSPLPFQEIDELADEISSKTLLFPCHFHVVFLGFDYGGLAAEEAEKLLSQVRDELLKFTEEDNVRCGSCSKNFTVSVTIDLGSGCSRAVEGDRPCSWVCGGMNLTDFDSTDDAFTETKVRDSLVGFYGYTVVVVNTGEEMKAVVGESRNAWILGRGRTTDNAISTASEIFFKLFVYGGKEDGDIHPEFIPVGADGKVILSFNLLNADPRDWCYDWDFRTMEDDLLSPVTEALTDVLDIKAESQVLYHTPKSSPSTWIRRWKSHILQTRNLPFFVNSNDWHLDTSISASGRSKILHFVVYVPSAGECPLRIQLPNGEISETNGFVSPTWGGVIIWNPTNCSRRREVRSMITYDEMERMFELFVGQLRQLLGFRSETEFRGTFGSYRMVPSRRGFTEWEIDVMSRQLTCFNLDSCSAALGSLSRLVQSLPRMIVKEEIGEQVKRSMEAADKARRSARLGSWNLSASWSREARGMAEDAFFDPSIMSVSYYSFEHCFAIYSPFLLPVLLHLIMAAVKEWRRYLRERRKYDSWIARSASPS